MPMRREVSLGGRLGAGSSLRMSFSFLSESATTIFYAIGRQAVPSGVMGDRNSNLSIDRSFELGLYQGPAEAGP